MDSPQQASGSLQSTKRQLIPINQLGVQHSTLTKQLKINAAEQQQQAISEDNYAHITNSNQQQVSSEDLLTKAEAAATAKPNANKVAALNKRKSMNKCKFKWTPSRRARKTVSWLLFVFALLVGLFALLGIIYLPTFVSKKVSKLLVLRNGSLLLERWSRPNAPMLFKVWLFDVENAAELLTATQSQLMQTLNSSSTPQQQQANFNNQHQRRQQHFKIKPRVREIGPFVFKMKRIKDVVSISGELLYYTERKVYYFDQQASCCSINTTVTVPNIPLAAIVDRASNVNVPLVNRIVPRLVNRAVQTLREKVFVKKQARELLFEGYDVELLKMVSFVGSLVGFSLPNKQKFALFLGKNDTWRPEVDGVWAINTGVSDSSKFGRVSSWNAHKSLPFWPAPQCNAINGSDGTLFPPPISKSQRLYIFNPDLCRTVNMVYERQSNVRSINSLRFMLNPENFAPTYNAQALNSSNMITSNNINDNFGVNNNHATTRQRTPLLRRARQRLNEQQQQQATANDSQQQTRQQQQVLNAQRRHVNLTRQRVDAKRAQNPLSCFCQRKNVELNGVNVCHFDGLIDMSRCQKNAAVIFGSSPHFSRADERLQRQVDGLSPNASIHTTYLDIEPNTGLVLAGKRRVQLNLLMRRNSDIDGYENISDMMVPVLWLEESAMIGEDAAKNFRTMYTDRIANVHAVLVSMLVGALALLALNVKLWSSSFAAVTLSAACNGVDALASTDTPTTNSQPSNETETTDNSNWRRLTNMKLNEEYAAAAKRTFERLRSAPMAAALRNADTGSGTPLMAATNSDAFDSNNVSNTNTTAMISK